MNETPDPPNDSAPADGATSPKHNPWGKRLLKGFIWTMVVLITVIVLLTVGLHWRGQRAWAEAQAALRDAGYPVTLRDLEFPSVSDTENFGAIAALKHVAVTEGENGDEGPGQPVRDRIEAALLKRDGSVAERPSIGDLHLGEVADLDAWSDYLAEHERIQNAEGLAGEPSAARRILAALATHRPLFDELAEAVDRPHARLAPPLLHADLETSMFLLQLPHLNPLMELGRTLSLRAVAAARVAEPGSSEAEIATASLRTISRLAELSAGDGLLIGQLVAVTQWRMLAEALWQCQLADCLSAEQWAAIQHDLERVDAEASLLRAYKSELVASLDTLEILIEQPELILGSGDLRKSDARVVGLLPTGVIQQNRATIADLFRQYILDPLVGGGLRGQLEQSDELEAAILEQGGLVPPDGIFATIMMPALDGVVRRFAFTVALLEQARTGCALERFRLTEGGGTSYPETLEELVPDYLDALPRDTIAGGAMRYQRLDEGGYRLWSLGFDGVDDDGEMNFKKPEKPSARDLDDDDYRGDWTWTVERP